jgi:hypothetical protein
VQEGEALSLLAGRLFLVLELTILRDLRLTTEDVRTQVATRLQVLGCREVRQRTAPVLTRT